MIESSTPVKLLFMATVAERLNVFEFIIGMAIQTIKAPMGCLQVEVGVLEPDRLPSIGGVTLLAIPAQLHSVRSVLPPLHVAVDALARIPLKLAIRVTFTAGKGLMDTDPQEIIQKMMIIFDLRERL